MGGGALKEEGEVRTHVHLRPPLLPSYLISLVKVGVAAKRLDHLRVAFLGGHVGWGGAVLKG